MKNALIRYLILFLLLAVIVTVLMLMIGGDRYLLLSPGTEDSPVDPGGYKLSYQFLLLAAVAGVAGIILLWSFLRFLYDLPSRIRTGASRRKRGQALEAMEEALIAASAGNSDKARKKAARAKALIDRPTLGSLVAAQAAEAAGDQAEAKAQYMAMLDNEKTRLVGLRGLAQLASARGDHASAMDFAQQACADDPNCHWAFDTLFAAQLAKHDWAAAQETLARLAKGGGLSKEVIARRKTVLQIAQAADLEARGEMAKARSLAKEAAGNDPAFAPGVALAARLMSKAREGDEAAKLLEKAWSKAPHPALALSYRDLISGEAPDKRAKRLKAFVRGNKDHRESRLVQIEEDLRSGDAIAAWSQLSTLLKAEEPSARLCELAAAAEEQLNNKADARLWLSRAAGAPQEPDWSDLDPAGDGFAYAPSDWQRLVFSYGDEGKLIHPRHERFERARPALGKDSAKLLAAKEETKPVAEDGPVLDD